MLLPIACRSHPGPFLGPPRRCRRWGTRSPLPCRKIPSKQESPPKSPRQDTPRRGGGTPDKSPEDTDSLPPPAAAGGQSGSLMRALGPPPSCDTTLQGTTFLR